MEDKKRRELATVLSYYRNERCNLAEAMEKIDRIYNPKLHGKEIWDKIKENGRFNPDMR